MKTKKAASNDGGSDGLVVDQRQPFHLSVWKTQEAEMGLDRMKTEKVASALNYGGSDELVVYGGGTEGGGRVDCSRDG